MAKVEFFKKFTTT